MRSAPPMCYDGTALRPPWPALPAKVRAAVCDRLGAAVVDARPAGAGFTRGFAAVLTTADGGQAFVKATDIDYLVEAYRREAVVTAALPAGVPAPRSRWTAAVDGWLVLCLDAVEGRVPALPWAADELAAALDAWAVAARLLPGSLDEVLRGSPDEPVPGSLGQLAPPPFGVIAAQIFTVWTGIAAHRAPLPALPRYALGHLDELAHLERRLLALADEATGPDAGGPVMHGDLRLDNVLIDRAGQAWLCDWNHVCRGPAWFDTLSLLVTAYASGHDASALFAAHPTAPDTAPDALDAGLAALAGLLLYRAGLPSDASPSIHTHQRWTGEMALEWLASRRGWAVPARPDAA